MPFNCQCARASPNAKSPSASPKDKLPNKGLAITMTASDGVSLERYNQQHGVREQ
jgi:hypothetical protein